MTNASAYRHRLTVACSRTKRECPAILTTAAGAGRMVISLVVFLISSVTGEIRCFCNQPVCVSTGYMCKSQIGLCVLQTTQDGSSSSSSVTRTVHACAETLSEPQRIACAAAQDDVTVATRQPQEPITDDPQTNLICCATDMCNYKPRLFINIYISRVNNTSEKDVGLLSGREVSDWSLSGHLQLWFRVAVIIVPLIGAVLLVAIVLAAVRMLRNDRKQQHHRRRHHHHHHHRHHNHHHHHHPQCQLRHCSACCPLANDACKEEIVGAEASSMFLSPLFIARQSQWRKQKICPTICDHCASRDRASGDAGTRDTTDTQCKLTLESNSCCHGCMRDVTEVCAAMVHHTEGNEELNTTSRTADNDFRV